ncbi:SDR family oxidoreductase [Pendulispora rubella]|uniref:SDR family oxidoreductase n=1 Tax=Pendulispora rubella TaxID=2741070 RepID=A0ABZ2KV92_9BACT
MILVTGATGHVGSELLPMLVARGHTVRAMSRRPEAALFPEGVAVVRGDFDDGASLDAAMQGVHRVFLVTTQAIGSIPAPTHEARVVEAARRARVRHIVKLSVLGGAAEGTTNDPIARWHHAAEGAIKESGIAWTMLRPGRFMSNALQWSAMIRETGKVHVSFARRPAASIDPADIAAVAVCALTEPGHEGKAHELSGPEALTPEQEIALLGTVLGRPLSMVPLDNDAARAGMRRWGMSDEVIDAAFARSEAAHGTEVLPTVQQVTGRAARTFEQWARAHAGAFR